MITLIFGYNHNLSIVYCSNKRRPTPTCRGRPTPTCMQVEWDSNHLESRSPILSP